MCDFKCGTVFQKHQQTMPIICLEIGKKRNALYKDIKQIWQMAVTDKLKLTRMLTNMAKQDFLL